MENKNIPQERLSDKSAEFNNFAERTRVAIEAIDNIAESIRETIENIPKFNFTPPIFSDDFMDAVNETSERQIECREKRETNFYYVKEELSYKYGARHYRDFDKWYKKFIMGNPSYYDLPYGYILNTTDEVIQYTDPESNTTVKIIGVNSVAYELFAEYREKQHDAQKQGLVWGDADEMARMEKFIKDVSIEQPVQLQDPNESVKDKVIRELNNADIEKYFKNENDFLVFVEALSLHLSNKGYILPQPIKLQRGSIAKIAKAVYVASYGRPNLRDDTQLFDLMRVLSSFKEKSNKQIYYDMQRTK